MTLVAVTRVIRRYRPAYFGRRSCRYRPARDWALLGTLRRGEKYLLPLHVVDSRGIRLLRGHCHQGGKNFSGITRVIVRAPRRGGSLIRSGTLSWSYGAVSEPELMFWRAARVMT